MSLLVTQCSALSSTSVDNIPIANTTNCSLSNRVEYKIPHQDQLLPTPKFNLVISFSEGRHQIKENLWFNLPPVLKLSKYQISEDGRVKNKSTGYEITCKPKKSSGYVSARLINDNNERKLYLFHRLVAATFLENPDNKPCVDHINMIRHDNRAVNLRWCTHRENAQNRSKRSSDGRRRPILQEALSGEIIQIWRDATEAGKSIGITASPIRLACKTRKICRGFRWSYYQEVIKDEIWQNITLQETTIGISTCGRIKFPNGRISYGSQHQDYRRTNIKGKNYYMHRLVCTVYNPLENYEGLEINHKDRNKANNNINNLEWCTRSENIKHEVQTSRRDKSKEGGCRKVSQLDSNGKVINIFPSITEAFKRTGVVKTSICAVCRGRRKSAGGYIWEYC